MDYRKTSDIVRVAIQIYQTLTILALRASGGGAFALANAGDADGGAAQVDRRVAVWWSRRVTYAEPASLGGARRAGEAPRIRTSRVASRWEPPVAMPQSGAPAGAPLHGFTYGLSNPCAAPLRPCTPGRHCRQPTAGRRASVSSMSITTHRPGPDSPGRALYGKTYRQARLATDRRAALRQGHIQVSDVAQKHQGVDFSCFAQGASTPVLTG